MKFDPTKSTACLYSFPCHFFVNTHTTINPDSQCNTGTYVERFSGRTYLWRRDCNSNRQEVVSKRDRKPGRELPQA